MTKVGLALAGLRHRPLRLLLSVASVSVATAALTVALSLEQRISAIRSPDRDFLSVNSIAEPYPLTQVKELAQFPGVDPTVWLSADDAKGGERFHYDVIGASERYFEMVPRSWYSAPPDAIDRWRGDRQAIVVGSNTAAQLGWKVGDAVTMDLPAVGPVSAHVVGLAGGYGPGNVIAHYEYVNELKRDKPDHDRVLRVWANAPPEKFGQLSREIDDHFASSSDPTSTQPFAVATSTAVKRFSAVAELLAEIGFLIVLVTAIITASTITMSLRERRLELGVLRALGFWRSAIVRVIVTESILVSLLGGALGSALPWLLLHEHGLKLGPWALSNVTVSGAMAIVSLGAAVLMGILVALFPARSAARTDILQMLSQG